jgi:hypothetical protein
MNELLHRLSVAEGDLRRLPAGSPQRDALLQQLRETVPAPILAHFLRIIDQGGHGVTFVRHGVCSGCHLRVASGLVAALARPDDLHLCENCGSYLVLPPEEAPSVKVRETPVATRRKAGRPRAVLV